MREKIKELLIEFQKKLEDKFEFSTSELVNLKPAMPGNSGLYLSFELNKLSISIFFWESGVIDIGSCYFPNGNADFTNVIDLVYFIHTPKNYKTLFYPEESFNLLIEKLKELEILIENYNI